MVLFVVEYYVGVVHRVLLGWRLVLAVLCHSRFRVLEGCSGFARLAADGVERSFFWMAFPEADLTGSRCSDGTRERSV